MIAGICLPSTIGRKCQLLEKVGRGLQKHGVETKVFRKPTDPVEGDFIVVYAPPGQPTIRRDDYRIRVSNMGLPVLGVDGGILAHAGSPRKEGAWWWHSGGMFRIYWYRNGMVFPDKDYPPDRFEKLGYTLKPKHVGKNIVVSDCSEADHRGNGTDYENWAAEVIAKLKGLTDRPIIYRPHPHDRKDKPKINVEISRGCKFEELLPDMFCHVSNFTTCELEVLINGIPNISLHPWSFARPMSHHDLESVKNPVLLERQRWFNRIGYWQWTVEEIEEGLFWPDLGEMT